MKRSLFRMFAIAACAAGAVQTGAQPARVPVSQLGPTAAPFVIHPYKAALAAVVNYRSCGATARPAAVTEVTNALRSIEAAAVAKGLGPILERLRVEYEQLMAVSDMVACAHGPSWALADARRALAAFRAWVAEQPRQR